MQVILDTILLKIGEAINHVFIMIVEAVFFKLIAEIIVAP